MNGGKTASKPCHSTSKDFVDDLNVVAKGRTLLELKENIEDDLKRLETYLIDHKMVINTGKTQLMLINTKTEDSPFKVTINGQDIEHQEVMKILGITLSSDLKFDHHIWKGNQNMVKSVGFKISVLKTLKPFLPTKILAAVGNALVNSTIMYGAPLWGGTTSANIAKLQSAQVKAGRAITGSGPKMKRTHRQQMFNQLNWPNVTQLIYASTLNLAKRGIEKKSSEGINNLFKVTTPRQHRALPTMRLHHRGPLTRQPNVFSSHAEELFNELPDFLKNPALTINQFKRHIKIHTRETNLLKEH